MERKKSQIAQIEASNSRSLSLNTMILILL